MPRCRGRYRLRRWFCVLYNCGSRTAGGVLSCRDKKVPKETLSLRRESFLRFSAETGVGRQHIPVLRPTRASRARPCRALSVSACDARRAGRVGTATHGKAEKIIPLINTVTITSDTQTVPTYSTRVLLGTRYYPI